VLSRLLSELSRCNNSEFHRTWERDHPSPGRAPFLSLWSTSTLFLEDVVQESLDKIVDMAIHDEDTACRCRAEEFLRELGQSGKLKAAPTKSSLLG
jgi:hypothetical protein